jgi:hypothetical protein
MRRQERPRISKSIPQDVLARYLSGELIAKQVGELCRVTTSTALQRLRDAGADTSRKNRFRFRRHPNSIRLHIPDQLLKRYAVGEVDTPLVARMFGVSVIIALRELKRAGADTSRSTRKKLWNAKTNGTRDAMIVQLYQRGMSLHQVAARVGMAHNSVLYILVREGIPRRPDGRHG